MSRLYESASPHESAFRDVAPAGVNEARGSVRIIDVREPHEFAGELAHVPGAELVPLAIVETAARTWDKDAEIVLVCRSGARSGRVAAMLASMGFRRVMNMVGGMLAWNEAKLPTEA